MTSQSPAEALLYTNRGQKWLAQFAIDDHDVARKIVRSLTLVSHIEFERVIQSSLEAQAEKKENPTAFYAIREVDPSDSYFDVYTDSATGEIDALASGADHGSEARIAAIIRNFCKTDPRNLLNHPTLDQMRTKKCRTIILVDDFIGSGERTKEFIAAFWSDPTITSWHSLGYIKIVVVAYSGTDRGVRVVKRHKAKPVIILERSCPTYTEMPWGKQLRKSVMDVCKIYGSKTTAGYWWKGYGDGMAALVFEHGCPDNTPAILWAPDEPAKPWQPLFPNRAILAGEQSVFPPEIARGDPIVTLVDVGQKKLAQAGQLVRRGKLGETILLILSLLAKGQRKESALGFATGLNQNQCAEIIDRCIRWGFVTSSRRITARGHAELQAARKNRKIRSTPPEKGGEDYFPQQLRRTTRG